MTEAWKPPAPGALDDTAWPERLVARAVDRGHADDRLHGYEVLRDVTRNYAYSDVLYLAIVGELPDDRAAKQFQIALCSFCTIAVTEAPAHVAVLSRICGGAMASALGAGLLSLADQARHKVQAHADLLAWLAAPSETLPPTDEADGPWVETLLATLAHARCEARLVRDGMSRDAARIALLFEAGVRTAEQLEAAIVASRFCGLAAEALATGPRDLGQYPVKLPPFEYVEDRP